METKKTRSFSSTNRVQERLSAIPFIVLFATILALALTWAIAQPQPPPKAHAQPQPPDFTSSYKTGDLYVKPGETVAYTIVVKNTGGAIQNVLLSDTLPSGVTLVPGSCGYFDGVWWWPCGPMDNLWNGRRDFAPGDRITTTFAATVSASANTLHYPLVNRAYIDWENGQHAIAHTTFIMHTLPKFSLFYEPEPNNADRGETITYTIISVNTGDAVPQVVLSNTLPANVAFAPGSCAYDVGPNPPPSSLNLPCNDLTPGELSLAWEEDMPHGARITTTFRITVTAPEGSARWPIQNCAYLEWDIVREQACYTALANPTTQIFLPLVMRNWTWWYAYDVYEPNDTPTQAYGPLTSGETYQAYIWNTDDAVDDDAVDDNDVDVDDYYYIEPSARRTVTIDLWRIPEGADYDLYVYCFDCSSLDKHPHVKHSNEVGNQPEHVRFTPEPGRRYYIRIHSDLTLGGGYNNEVPYHLRVYYE